VLNVFNIKKLSIAVFVCNSFRSTPNRRWDCIITYNAVCNYLSWMDCSDGGH